MAQIAMQTPIPGSSAPSVVDVFPKLFVFDKPTSYRLREKATAPDSFEVEALPSKSVILTIRGKVTSFHGEKKMFDADDNPLFKMTENSFAKLHYQYLFDFRDKSVYTVRKRGFLPFAGRGTLCVWKGKGDSGEHMAEVRTSGMRAESTIVERKTGRVLARINRSVFGPKKLLAGADTYKLRVFSGVDVALVMMLTVCVDEQYNDDNI